MTTSKQNTDVQKLVDYTAGKDYSNYEQATFAGGCFWCTEASFERIEGVIDVFSGYSGGVQKYPTYKQVGYGETDHAEAIQIYYDPAIITYAKLLGVFFVAHDPTTLNRQGPDKGPQYRSAIYYRTDKEKTLIDAYIAKLNTSGKFSNPIVTEIAPYREFWSAESYHQNYYELHPENPYVGNVSRPKVEKVKKVFADILKEKYKKS
ncbi:MAG: peptide-methionine (S)-S-oxide reductase [Saprospiraceae bacterium]|jgi:peptide-methionine (S)-S-oxide reductase